MVAKQAPNTLTILNRPEFLDSQKSALPLYTITHVKFGEDIWSKLFIQELDFDQLVCNITMWPYIRQRNSFVKNEMCKNLGKLN